MKKNWRFEEVSALYELPFIDLIFKAQTIHRENFDPNALQLNTLINIKTGGCPEDCAYCPQSAHYDVGIKREKLMTVDDVISKAKVAKENGASRFCMGAAWRNLGKREFNAMKAMIKGVKALGMQTCMTLGMLTREQAQELQEEGLDYYNHNLDTSPAYYKKIITTRSYEDRLQTLKHVRDAGMNVCCGGIIGMGETREDRIGLLLQLANMEKSPDSVPINMLIPVAGTPLENTPKIDIFEFIRTVAIARITMPVSMVRLSAGRDSMSEEMQTLCFIAGANSLHFGEKLLMCKNADEDADRALFKKLKMTTFASGIHPREACNV